jgi:hypothetical protein
MKLRTLIPILIAVLALGINPLSARDLTEGEWYVRLVLTAETEALEDSSNALGQLKDATLGYDNNYDLPEPDQPWAGTYLTVIFYRPDWEAERETFNTDYHPISAIGPVSGCGLPPETGIEEGDEWTFEVRSNDLARQLSLTWIGEGTNMGKMVLVDLQENVMVAAVVDGVQQEYGFTMNGAVREFAWRLLTNEQYEAFIDTGEVSASLVAFDQASASSVTTDGVSTTENTKKKSEWLPLGWGQGQGNSSDRPVPEGLPDDPFGD